MVVSRLLYRHISVTISCAGLSVWYVLELLSDTEYGGSTHLRNIGELLPEQAASHLRRHKPSYVYITKLREMQKLLPINPYATFVHSGCVHHVTNIKITRRNWQHSAPVAGRQTKAYLTALFRVLL